jgi:hypothetical protein
MPAATFAHERLLEALDKDVTILVLLDLEHVALLVARRRLDEQIKHLLVVDLEIREPDAVLEGRIELDSVALHAVLHAKEVVERALLLAEIAPILVGRHGANALEDALERTRNNARITLGTSDSVSFACIRAAVREQQRRAPVAQECVHQRSSDAIKYFRLTRFLIKCLCETELRSCFSTSRSIRTL